MKPGAFALFSFLLLSASSAFELNQTREQMLAYYYSKIDENVPKSARLLLGDEKVNIRLGGKTIGISILHGSLESFELLPVPDPTIEVEVSDRAAEAIVRKETGVLAAIESGGIRIRANNWFSGVKMEALKRIYALSRIDDLILGKKKQADIDVYNSIYVQRARFWNAMLSG